jgi:hypothetical protein
MWIVLHVDSTGMRRSLRLATIALGSLLAPTELSAHLVSSGLGPVYDGAWHFVLTPEEVLPIAGIALFAGLRGPVHARRVSFFLPLAWLLGCLSAVGTDSEFPAILAAISLLLIGGLLAANLKFPPFAITIFAVLLGFAFGYFSGQSGNSLGQMLPMALGATACVFVLLSLVASVSLPLRRMPAIIAVRVAGSWMVALGLLLLGWFIHGRRS